MLKKILILLNLVAFSLYAQLPGNGSVQVLVKGVITDEFTSKPCESTITIKDKNGKKFKIKSNSIDGTYEQILTSGETYEFTFLNFDVLKKVESLYVESTKKYTEFRTDFTVKKLNQGLHLFVKNVFHSGSEEIYESPDEILKELEEILIYNRSAKFEFIVTAHDTYASTPKIAEQSKVVKGKKNKQKVKSKTTSVLQKPEPDVSLVRELVDKRMIAIQNLTANIMKRNKHRLSFRPDYSLNESGIDDAKLSMNPDFIIEVIEIKNAFD